MDSEIQFITSSSYVVERCSSVFRENGYVFPIKQVQFNKLEKFVSDSLVNGTKIFVSRGKTAALLKKMNLDVVSLRFTYYDFFTAMQQALKISSKVAVLGYEDSWSPAIEPYYEILNKPLIVNLTDESELDSAICNLKEHGIGVIICGHTAREIAKRYNIPTVQIGLETSSILDSIEEARYLLQIKMQLNSRSELLRAVFNNAVEAVISVDASGSILNANQNALNILGKACVGKNIADYIPDPIFLPSKDRSLRFRHELCKVNNILCTVNISSFINIDEQQVTIYFFQPIAQVQSLEYDIRKKQHFQRNVARSNFSNIAGTSSALNTTIDLAKRFAQSNRPILIHGEIGTGKELFAQSIHNFSSRFSKPFVTVSCATLSRDILEREVFGYTSNQSAADSVDGFPGLIEAADGGSIFFDEIGEMPKEIQSKLLGILQDGEVHRIGSNYSIPVDIRIIASTRHNILKLIQEGRFREDLYYRLSVLQFTIPPLRQRREDILPIAESILEEHASHSGSKLKHLSDSAKKCIISLDWPGNSRQLRNIMERICVLCDSDTISADLLKATCNDIPTTIAPTAVCKVSEREMHRIRQILKEEGGSRSRAAARLGISKTTLWRRMLTIEETYPGYFDSIPLRKLKE